MKFCRPLSHYFFASQKIEQSVIGGEPAQKHSTEHERKRKGPSSNDCFSYGSFGRRNDICVFVFAAHADAIDFTISGSAGGFSGSGVLTTTLDGSGNYLITGITASGVTGLIAPGGFNGNDNLFFPSDPFVFDSNGFSFGAADGSDQFDVNVFSNGTGYFAFFRDEDGSTGTLPVSLQTDTSVSAVPEPSTLLLIGTGALGVAGAIRRRISV